jgi:hypothetical protein
MVVHGHGVLEMPMQTEFWVRDYICGWVKKKGGREREGGAGGGKGRSNMRSAIDQIYVRD